MKYILKFSVIGKYYDFHRVYYKEFNSEKEILNYIEKHGKDMFECKIYKEFRYVGE